MEVGVEHGGWCVAWRLVCSMEVGVEHGGWCVAWRLVCSMEVGVEQGLSKHDFSAFGTALLPYMMHIA